MDLSIIINNYETKGLLKQCLRGIQLSNIPLQYEVIVVDSASKDRIDQMMKTTFKDFKYIRSDINKGAGGGNNLGILRSSGDYILIINPDITILDDSIINLFNFLNQQEKIGAVGPKILNTDGTRQTSCLRFPRTIMPVYRRRFADKRKSIRQLKKIDMYDETIHSSQPLPVDWIIGSCLMIKRSVLDEVGLFDERYFLFMEDTDLCRRIHQAGWQVWYHPNATVISYPSRFSRKTWKGPLSYFTKYTLIHFSSWLKYLKKWGIKPPKAPFDKPNPIIN